MSILLQARRPEGFDPSTSSSHGALRRRARLGAFLGTLACVGPLQGSSVPVLQKPAPRAVGHGPPEGNPRESKRRPTDIEPPGCSPIRPVCVHRGADVADETAVLALEKAEHAYERIVLALGLPAPLPGGEARAIDLYLAPRSSKEPLRVVADRTLRRVFDGATGYCVVAEADPALLERALTQCIAELSLLRLDPAEAPELRRAIASELFLNASLPTSPDVQAVSDFQAQPERAPATRSTGAAPAAESEGAALFFDYFETTRGLARPASFTTAWFALSGGTTPPRAWRHRNEPDLFDALRQTLGESSSAVARELAAWAVARAFAGSRDDPSELPHFDFAGDFGKPRLDWVLSEASLPRRVAGSRPLEPTGSAYVLVELDSARPERTLGFQATWEEPVAFVWTLVRIGKDGRELSRLEVPFQERATEVEQRITNLKGARALLIVGTNAGGIDRAYAFDPDHAPFERHGFIVYVTALP